MWSKRVTILFVIVAATSALVALWVLSPTISLSSITGVIGGVIGGVLGPVLCEYRSDEIET